MTKSFAVLRALFSANWQLHRKVFIAVGVFTATMNVLLLVPSFYMMTVYDRVLTSRNETTLLALTLILLFLYGVYGALEGARGQALVAAKIGADPDFADKIYRAGLKEALSRQSSLGAGAVQDMNTVRQSLTGSTVFAVCDAPWFPVYLVVIALFNVWLGLFAVLSIALMVALAIANDWITRKSNKSAAQDAVKIASGAMTHQRHAEVIWSMGMVSDLAGHWLNLYRNSLNRQEEGALRTVQVSAVTKTVRMTLQSLVLGVAAYLVLENKLSAGMMIAASILLGRALSPVEQLIAAWPQAKAAVAAYERLNQLASKYPPGGQKMPLPAPTGALKVTGLSVAAPNGRAPIVRGVGFELQPGDVLGVVGASGSGKSTLVKGLLGLWPSQGDVRLDGSLMTSWPEEDIGRYLGYVPQDVSLFEGSVAQNIARMGDVDAEKVIAAARAAGVEDLIKGLPEGFETAVGPDGGALSGGQRQRVALARALYGAPPLVVLDEANANLDQVGETSLLKAIQDLSSSGVTVILVAHRREVLQVVTKLLVMNQGQMSAFGPRDEVLTRMQAGKSS